MAVTATAAPIQARVGQQIPLRVRLAEGRVIADHHIGWILSGGPQAVGVLRLLHSPPHGLVGVALAQAPGNATVVAFTSDGSNDRWEFPITVT